MFYIIICTSVVFYSCNMYVELLNSNFIVTVYGNLTAVIIRRIQGKITQNVVRIFLAIIYTQI